MANKNLLIIILLISTSVIALCACDKDKRASKGFIDVGTWEVEATVFAEDNSKLTFFALWEVYDCEINENECTANWKQNNDSDHFKWKFSEDALFFTISAIDYPDNSGQEETISYIFSGKYNVVHSTSVRKTFESKETIGFKGHKVEIKIQRMNL